MTSTVKASVVRQERELLEGAVEEERKRAWHKGSVKIKCQQSIYVHGLQQVATGILITMMIGQLLGVVTALDWEAGDVGSSPGFNTACFVTLRSHSGPWFINEAIIRSNCNSLSGPCKRLMTFSFFIHLERICWAINSGRKKMNTCLFKKCVFNDFVKIN